MSLGSGRYLSFRIPSEKTEISIDNPFVTAYKGVSHEGKDSLESGSPGGFFIGENMEKAKKSIAVIDGQGGGIGSVIIKRLREAFSEELEIIALGTNAMATGSMLKAGANKGASGENAIIQTVKTVDVVIGTTGIVIANSMMGELTPMMAGAIASSPALKCLLPLRMQDVEIIGAPKEPLPHLVDQLIKRIQEIIVT